MLSGSAILRVLLVIVAAGGIAGIVQQVWLRGAAPDPIVSEKPDAAVAPRPAEPVRTVRPVEPAPSRPGAPPPSPPDEPRPAPAVASPPPLAQPSLPSPAPVSPEPDPVLEAEQNAPPAAVALTDLNTASLAALNGLKGGGAIGRTIIQHRPYSSVEQLLSKRVLNRATYQRIRDQVTVQ